MLRPRSKSISYSSCEWHELDWRKNVPTSSPYTYTTTLRTFPYGRTSHSSRLLRCELEGHKLALCSLVTHRKINRLDIRIWRKYEFSHCTATLMRLGSLLRSPSKSLLVHELENMALVSENSEASTPESIPDRGTASAIIISMTGRWLGELSVQHFSLAQFATSTYVIIVIIIIYFI